MAVSSTDPSKKINYATGQTGQNGQQTSPILSQADLPKYQNVDQFDFNRNYEDTLDQLRRQQADLTQGHDLDNQRLNETYARRLRDIERQRRDATINDQSRLASQGILRSGIAVESAGNIGEGFQSELDQNQRQLATEIENRAGAHAQAQRQIQEQIGKAQEYQTRQQQMIEQQRAAQAAAAQAATNAANWWAGTAEQQKPMANVVKDNLGKYFLVDPNTMTRQSLDQNALAGLSATHKINNITTMDQASQLFGGDYAARANALARRLGGNLNSTPSLDVRLGFRQV